MILITGASAGIGEACAMAFAKAGHPLFLVARRKDRLEKLSAKLKADFGAKAKIAVLDVTKPTAVESFFKKNRTELNRVRVLVNNAGLARGISSFQSSTLEDWDAMLDTNVRALLHFTRLALPPMIEKKQGHIIHIGSVAGRWFYAGGHVYCATKAAVHAFTQSLRLDLLGTGIRVTEISPGMVETEFSQVRLKDKVKAKAVYAGMTPLTPQDIAANVLWCAQQPPHVNIQDLVIYPTDQAAPGQVFRR